MSQVSVIFGIAPAVAPVVGGWLLGWQRWPAIFWFLVAFSAALLVATWIALPETHPKPARLAPSPRALLRDYAGIFVNPRFQRLAAAGTFNFGALFLYIASAPAFVLELLRRHGRHLGEDEFAWFFVPMISGMMLGAVVSGRMAGRIGGAAQTRIGFACCGVAMAANVAVNAFAPSLEVPWAVLPMMLNAFGIALVFPILTLAILDMYPRMRGSASSLQAFTGLVCNAVIAGLLSPLLSGDGLHLALGAAAFAFLAWAIWRWEMHAGARLPAGDPELAAALEPTDRL
jgi:DHA1 family bicyclomycin/chloramphenicol resistance-like MFS transporter